MPAHFSLRVRRGVALAALLAAGLHPAFAAAPQATGTPATRGSADPIRELPPAATSKATVHQATVHQAMVHEATVREAEGAHFRVRVHFDAQLVADEILTAAESVVPFARNVYGDARIAPDAKPTIHFYADEIAWRRVENELGQGAFSRGFAFSHAPTGEAHLAAMPQASEELLAQVGTPLLWKRLAAHEAVHLWSYRAWPRAVELPFWFGEGAAQWAAEQGMQARGSTHDPMEDPFPSTQALFARALLMRDWLPAASELVDGLPGGLTFDERYAVTKVLFEFLRTPAQVGLFGRLRKAAREGTQAGTRGAADPQVPISAALRAALDTPEAIDAFDAAFRAHVRALAPNWDEGFRSLWPVGDGWAQVAFADTNALAWRTAPCGGDPYEVEGQFAILPGPAWQMNVLLARSEHAFVQVAFTAGHGVDVFEYDSRRGPDGWWKKLASARAEGFDVGAFHRFRVVVEAPTISVWLDGKPLCAPRLDGYDLSGPFGLGALARTSGLWRNVAFRKL